MARVVVIGTGSIGERHARCFQQTGRADVSICEVNAELRAAVQERYGLARAFATLAKAMASQPDAAVICTPAHLHVSMAIELAQAGIGFLMEKPVSTSLERLDELQSLLERRALPCAVAYVNRANPILAAMRKALHSGRFGKPVQLVAVSGQHFPFYRPAYREIYYRDRATGGGAVQDALTHMANAGEWLVGPMTDVAADAGHLVLPGVEVEDTVHVLARHGDVMGCYSLNQHQAPNETSLTVNCERGTVRFEPQQHRWRWQTAPDGGWTDEVHPPLERDTLFVRQAEMFLDVLDGKAEPACGLAEGIQTLRVNLAILRAADSRTWQRV